MKRLLPLLFLIIALTGCAVKEAVALECLSDTLDYTPDPSCIICVDLPSDALLTASARDGKDVLFSCSNCDIYEEIFTADSPEAAVKRVTGLENVTAYQVGGTSPLEYRFAWSTSGEQGEQACSATLLYDGSNYYAVSVHCAAEDAPALRQTVQEILTSVCLESI